MYANNLIELVVFFEYIYKLNAVMNVLILFRFMKAMSKNSIYHLIAVNERKLSR